MASVTIDWFQVKSLAVREERQGQSIGRMPMARALDVSREQRRSTLLVATAAADETGFGCRRICARP